MKKLTACMAACLLLTGLLGGCGGNSAPAGDSALRVVCAGAPEYDWTRNILGENPAGIELTLLVGNGTDLHSYQATAEDILRIAESDLLVYTGGVSGQWITDAVSSGKNERRVVLNMLDVLGDRVAQEELVEGMEPEAHDGDAAAHSEVDDGEADEHVWLSLRNAQLICGEITQALCRLDPDGAETYRANAEAYTEKLDALDKQYAAMADTAGLDTILVADRFPFRYLVDDYALHYYAAFAGCSAETDASFETVIFLAGKLDELKLPAVLVIDGSNSSIADAVLGSSADGSQAVLTLDSMQSMSRERLNAGESYLTVMEGNFTVLTQALTPLD